MERNHVLCEQLLLFRRRKDLSQQEVATMTGLYKTDISKYECGVSMPTIPRLLRLATALGVTPNDLLGIEEGVCKS